MGIITGFLTLYGLGMGGWLAGQGIKSAVSSMSDGKPKLEPINLKVTKSASGRCHVENFGYYAPMKKFVADVICKETEEKVMAVADTLEGLEKRVEDHFKVLERKLRKQHR